MAKPRGMNVIVEVTPSAAGLTPLRGGTPSEPLLESFVPTPVPFSFSSPYFDPYPSDWSRQLIWAFSFDTPSSLQGAITEVRPLASAPTTLAPRLSPPTGFTVDGHVASADQTLSSPTPLLAWSPPSRGSPSGYQGILQPLTPQDPATLTFVTTGTRFRVPAGVLTSGNQYAFQLLALYGPSIDLSNAPRSFYTATDSSLAMTVSGVWTAP